jgi:tRNA(Ile)-lysidine synthase TilS/MesJ
VALSVHLGFDGFDLAPIERLCEELHVDYTIVQTDIARIIFEDRKESNPCSLCSKLRKGAFNKKAKELGCNKIAFAHHKDDIVETLLMSLLFEGRMQSFPPKTYLDRMDLTVIRPLIYVDESEIKDFMIRYQLPVQKNPCPSDGYTKREYAKNLVKQLEAEHEGAKNRMFHAIRKGHW